MERAKLTLVSTSLILTFKCMYVQEYVRYAGSCSRDWPKHGSCFIVIGHIADSGFYFTALVHTYNIECCDNSLTTRGNIGNYHELRRMSAVKKLQMKFVVQYRAVEDEFLDSADTCTQYYG